MPLHVSTAPPPALHSVLTALRSPGTVHGARTPAVARAARDALRPELPLPLHEMTGPGPDGRPRTRLTGWRFLLREAAPARASAAGVPTAVGTAETVRTAEGGWAFSHFSEGPYVTSTERALLQADALGTPHSPHLLSLPQLYMLTLWLRRPDEAAPEEAVVAPGDLLVPLAPAPPGIHAHRIHRAGALLPLLSRRMSSGPPLLTA